MNKKNKKMKNILLLIFLIPLSTYKLHAQMNFFIKEIYVSNLHIADYKNVIDENLEKGPFLYIVFVFENNSDTTVTLYPSKSKTNLLFRYMEQQYLTEVVSIPFLDIDTLSLQSKESKEVAVGVNFLLGTGLLVRDREDFLIEMIEILPTIKLNYIDDGVNIKTSEILYVKVK